MTTVLPQKSNIHWTFLGQVERGQRNLSLHNLLKLAAGLGVDPGELVEGLRPPEDDVAGDDDSSARDTPHAGEPSPPAPL